MQHISNKKNSFLATFFLLVPLFLFASQKGRSDVIFGNSLDGSYGIGIYSSHPYMYVSGAAVSFEPIQSFTLSSVTLSLSNYTQPFALELLAGTDLNNLSEVGIFNANTPNDGSLGEFTFNLEDTEGMPNPLTLVPNITYWLFASGGVNSSGTIEWMGASVPTGQAVYEGVATFEGDPTGSFQLDTNAHAPAFQINTVPEPRPLAIIIAGGALLLFLRRKSRLGSNMRCER